MTEIIGIRFKNAGKIYYFDPDGEKFKNNDLVVVKTANGIDYGTVATPNKKIDSEEIIKPLKKIVRPASDEDLAKIKKIEALNKNASKIAAQKIREHKLEMKLVGVESAFDDSKILFYFTADGRIDFRELVKDLASIFRTRIELRQIGVKDETKMIGGLGSCGREFCCSTFLTEFYPVSIRMAKDQGLSLNPSKISGACGRLMCCLRYEQDTYRELRKTFPKAKTPVETKDGTGVILEVNILTGMLKIKLDDAPDSAPVFVHIDDVNIQGRKKTPKAEEEKVETEDSEVKKEEKVKREKPEEKKPQTRRRRRKPQNRQRNPGNPGKPKEKE